MTNDLLQELHNGATRLVRGEALADCPKASFEECQEWFMDMLSQDQEAADDFLFKYWFWGLGYFVVSAPLLLFSIPFQMTMMLLAPEESVPGLPTVTTAKEATPLMWMNMFTFRLMMPYNYFLDLMKIWYFEKDYEPTPKCYNIRYMDWEKAFDWLTVDWFMLVPFWI